MATKISAPASINNLSLFSFPGTQVDLVNCFQQQTAAEVGRYLFSGKAFGLNFSFLSQEPSAFALYPHCHCIRKSRLDFQMINDHMEKFPMKQESILDIEASVNFPDECSHMNELSLRHVQQKDQPAEPWPNFKPIKIMRNNKSLLF